ncbi:MAG TPA: Crp/Fnr family transcriptional regulator [Bryobacteraceae bacterium]|jgi:CRP-like cAMP-binding protein|nr:Crp/Fnr family transcriptional regulator [Bryobacteraceae bacterium]
MRSFRLNVADEDPLTYLPRKPVREYGRGRVIYDADNPSLELFVVILGRVKITNFAEDGAQTTARIVCTEGLFGERCLVGSSCATESATALDRVTVMSWSQQELEAYIEQEPRLGIALSQHMVRQCLSLQDRIESMAIYKTRERVMLALLQLGRELGTSMPDGAMRARSLTHRTIAEFVGTSREIVSVQMNRLRRLGLIRYSRKNMDIYLNELRDHMKREGINPPQASEELAARAGVSV